MTITTKRLPEKIRQPNKSERENRKPMLSSPVMQKELESAYGEMALTFGLTPQELTDCLHGVGALIGSEPMGNPLEALQEIKALWEEQFPAESLKTWFRRPLPLFKGKAPLEKFQEGKAEQVVGALIRLREGMHV